MRVLQPRRQLDFPEESLGSDDSGQLGVQDFDRDAAVVSSASQTVAIPPAPISRSTR